MCSLDYYGLVGMNKPQGESARIHPERHFQSETSVNDLSRVKRFVSPFPPHPGDKKIDPNFHPCLFKGVFYILCTESKLLQSTVRVLDDA